MRTSGILTPNQLKAIDLSWFFVASYKSRRVAVENFVKIYFKGLANFACNLIFLNSQVGIIVTYEYFLPLEGISQDLKRVYFMGNHALGFTHRARKYKKVQAKKLVKSNKSKIFFHEIAFLAVLNFFPVQKSIFGNFWNCKK